MRNLLALLLLPTVTTMAAAQEQALTDVKGTKHYPLDVRGAKAVVLIFVAAECPIANYYTSEINAIVKEYATRPVRFYVVHADPDLPPADAAKHAATYGITCPVLIDTKHQLVKATGVTVTPEAAVLTPDGKIAYRGRIDDTHVDLGKRRVEPNRRELREALAAVLAGQSVKEPRTKAIGCFIPDLP